MVTRKRNEGDDMYLHIVDNVTLTGVHTRDESENEENETKWKRKSIMQFLIFIKLLSTKCKMVWLKCAKYIGSSVWRQM